MSEITTQNRMIPVEEPASEAPVVRPAYSVRQVEGAYDVGIPMPGVKREDITVRFEQDVLRVEGKRHPFARAEWRPLRREIEPATFLLELHVSVPVDAARVSARWEDGVLSLRLPLREEAKPREITVE